MWVMSGSCPAPRRSPRGTYQRLCPRFAVLAPKSQFYLLTFKRRTHLVRLVLVPRGTLTVRGAARARKEIVVGASSLVRKGHTTHATRGYCGTGFIHIHGEKERAHKRLGGSSTIYLRPYFHASVLGRVYRSARTSKVLTILPGQ